MKVEGIHLDGPSTQLQPVAPVVEATAVKGTLPDLFRGQRFTATVLEGNGSQVLVNVQGAQVTLPASASLRAGTEVLLRVANVSPQLLFEVLPTLIHSPVQLPPLFTSPEDPVHADALHVLRNTIAHRASAGESLQTLLPALTALISSDDHAAFSASAIKLHALLTNLLPDSGPPTADRLAAFVHDGGLLYEAKLQHEAARHPSGFAQVGENDVKGVLLQLMRDLEKARTTSPSFSAGAQQPVSEEAAEASVLRNTQQQELRQAINTHLEYIEGQQAVNVLARSQGEPYLLQIPFFTGQEMTTAFLAIQPEGTGHEEQGAGDGTDTKHGYHILFLLDLERLGQTRIEARIGSQSIWGAFYVEHAESVAELQAELPAFRATLQALGYEEVLLLAKPLGHLSAEKRQKFDALASGVPSSVHLLDVRA